MSNKTNYAVVSGVDIKYVVNNINSYLNKGWKLAGGISSSVLKDGSIIYTQAIYLEKE